MPCNLIENPVITLLRRSALDHVVINVPEKETYLVQELHLPVYHYLCAELEKTFFND